MSSQRHEPCPCCLRASCTEILAAMRLGGRSHYKEVEDYMRWSGMKARSRLLRRRISAPPH